MRQGHKFARYRVVLCITKKPDGISTAMADIEDSSGKERVICGITLVLLVAALDPLGENPGMCRASRIWKDWDTCLSVGRRTSRG